LLKRIDCAVGTTDMEEDFHLSRSLGWGLLINRACLPFFVMPDLIRHPEALEKTGFRLSPE